MKEQPLSYYGLLAAPACARSRRSRRSTLPRGDFKLAAIGRKARRRPGPAARRGAGPRRTDGRGGGRAAAQRGRARAAAGRGPGAGRAARSLPALRGIPARLPAGRRTRGGGAASPRPGATRAPSGRRPTRAPTAPLVEKEGSDGAGPAPVRLLHHAQGVGLRPRTATSRVDARGLLQLMPSLGEELSAKLRLPFLAEDLFRPEVNIRLGTRRLGELQRDVPGASCSWRPAPTTGAPSRSSAGWTSTATAPSTSSWSWSASASRANT